MYGQYKIIEIKKSVFITVAVATGVLFLIFLLVQIDGLRVAKKNHMAPCTETTWGTVTFSKSSRGRKSLMTSDKVIYTFEVNGQTIQGEYSAKTFGTGGSGAYTDGKVIVHYNPNNVYQNYFGNHCEQVDKAETTMIIAIILIGFWLIFSIAIYAGQRPYWQMEENEQIMKDYWRNN